TASSKQFLLLLSTIRAELLRLLATRIPSKQRLLSSWALHWTLFKRSTSILPQFPQWSLQKRGRGCSSPTRVLARCRISGPPCLIATARAARAAPVKRKIRNRDETSFRA